MAHRPKWVVYNIQREFAHPINNEVIKPSGDFYERVEQVCYIGDGRTTLFWTDRRLEEGRICDICPSLAAAIRPWVARTRTVREGVLGAWLEDVGPDLGAAAIAEFLSLWPRIQGFVLPNVGEDSLVWNWAANGIYSSKMSYSNRDQISRKAIKTTLELVNLLGQPLPLS
ncbi:hypothetical protein BRADI_1g55943v3 [Brachypodium distachyon]|uniref:Uncharacterized protein n=1 Tax=Brachypodium distachyon TaxID=15368 RepID=A0A2K2DRN3_BRADI|nr:hypothetical protein BRADI_1g55943v3 [Brachypodium distachyon]